MENYTRSRTSRFVIDEDFIPKATIDGESHEIMTLVAGVSGIIAAFIILAILMTFISRKDSEKSFQKSAQPTSCTDVDLENGNNIKADNLLNNYPLVLNLDKFNTQNIEEKNSTVKSLEVPQILNCNNLTLGKMNKAYTSDGNISSRHDSVHLYAPHKFPLPFVIVEKY